MFKSMLCRKQSCVDACTEKHATMGKNGHASERLLPQVVEKSRYARIELWKAFAVGGAHVHVVGIPALQIFVVDVFESAHLPVAHVHLFEAMVDDGMRVSAERGQSTSARQRRGEHCVEGPLRGEFLLCLGGFLRKGVA